MIFGEEDVCEKFLIAVCACARACPARAWSADFCFFSTFLGIKHEQKRHHIVRLSFKGFLEDINAIIIIDQAHLKANPSSDSN